MKKTLICVNISSMVKLEEQAIETKEENNSPKNEKKTASWKYALNISLILIITGVAVFFSVKDNGAEIWDLLSTANVPYLFALLGVSILQSSVRALILYCFARLYTRKYHMHQALATDQIGVFYNAVTPGASGGQIMQAYTFKKQGIQISAAVSIMAMYSIAFQIVLVSLGTLSFIIKYDSLMQLQAIPFDIGGFKFTVPIWPLTIFGFSINVLAIGGIFLMAYSKIFHNFVMGPCISLLHKLHIIKDADKQREALRIHVENFKIEFRRLFTNIPFFMLILFLFVCYALVKFSYPYFCGKALGNASSNANLFDSIVLSNYHSMVTQLIPIPGAAGVSEYFFAKLFVNTKAPETGFFYAVGGAKDSLALCQASLLMWRFFTFILPLVVAGFVTAFYRSSPKNEAHLRGELPNRKTFVDLQHETYISRQEELNTMVETMRLSRAAILEKLKKRKKSSKKSRSKKKKKDDSGNNNDDENREIRV